MGWINWQVGNTYRIVSRLTQVFAERVEAGIGRVSETRVVREEVARLSEGLRGAAEFFGSGYVVGNAHLFEEETVVGMLRFVATGAVRHVAVGSAGQGISAGAFLTPGAIRFRDVFGAWNVRTPTFYCVARYGGRRRDCGLRSAECGFFGIVQLNAGRGKDECGFFTHERGGGRGQG